VLLVLLAAVGLGVFLGTRDKDESPEVAQDEAAETETKAVVVPDLRGMTLERAASDAEAVGLVIGTTTTAIVDETVTPAGTVLSQDPLPGAEVEPGAAIALVIAEAPAEEPPAEDSSAGSSGSESSEPPAPPEDVTVEDIGMLTVVPRAIDLGLVQLQQWTTVVEHSDADTQWQSPTITLGSGEKRILLTADGTQGYPVAVWSWDAANDTDWHLESIVISTPGGATYETVLDAPTGNHTFLVKSSNASVLWTLKIQEKK
jgi:hypothetical protein